jgi:SAM-dependent methyltransferase
MTFRRYTIRAGYARTVCGRWLIEEGAAVARLAGADGDCRTVRHGDGDGVEFEQWRLSAIEPTVFYVGEHAHEEEPANPAILAKADTYAYDPSDYDADYFEGRKAYGFAPGSSTYEELARETEKKVAWLLRQTSKCRTFLELGCAKGFVVHALAERGYDSHGVDISGYAISHAYGKAVGRVQVADIRKRLPFEKQSFDVVHAWDTLEHIPPGDIHTTLNEITRIARRWVVMRVPVRTHLSAKRPVDWSYGPSDATHPSGKAERTHINVQPVDFWIEEMVRRSWISDHFEVWNGEILKGDGWLWFRR